MEANSGIAPVPTVLYFMLMAQLPKGARAKNF